MNNNYNKIKHNVRCTKEGSIKDVMKELFSYYHIEANLDEEDIIAAWKEITGELINKLTTKIYVQNNCLYVKVNASALKHELNMVKTSIMEKIKAKLPNSNLKNIYIS